MPLPLARTPAESHLYIQMHSCRCGTAAVTHVGSAQLMMANGDLARLNEVDCQGCGQRREFYFRLPERPLRLVAPQHFGDDRPSELFDAGQWLWMGMRLASHGASAGSGRRDGRQYAEVWEEAAAAVDEAGKFPAVRAGAMTSDDLPSDTGQAVFGTHAASLRPDALATRAGRYRAGTAMGDEANAPAWTPSHVDGLARNSLVDQVKARITRYANTRDAAVLLDRDAITEIDALLNPHTMFDLLGSLTAGLLLWERYRAAGNAASSDDLERSLRLFREVNANGPRMGLPNPPIPEAALALLS